MSTIKEISFETIDLVTKDPMKLFGIWRQEAHNLSLNYTPDAMSVATVKKDGSPAVRALLLRGVDEKGYRIYCDYRSPKGLEIASDNRAALLFVWAFENPKGEKGWRQVRIEGLVEKLTEKENQEYFDSEPITAQIRSTLNQSKVITDDRQSMREECKRIVDSYNADPDNFKIAKAETWGGYRIVPNMMEFYQGTRNDFNDRIRFKKINVDEPQNFTDPEPGVHIAENDWVYMQLEP